ncbi:DUF397 domain-containing protein [Streptomyces sp. CB01580]|uniref:DUF397 domain-containing protein n=1 Tax=Streptomyces sp. CB01580 TaxID=1703933 RepID=UPI00093BF67A|nr:DUF397 domain-containing protein [Streptomyces sp. CB01580]OKJ41552.1 hypothetical protein AMK22_08750 [Streptomyces sp. CB01580]
MHTNLSATDSTVYSGWYKSSHSGGANGECLEVARGHATVPVRDSKTPNGPALVFSTDGWTTFVAAVKGDSLGA